jgi:hypothetical protein
MNNILRGGVALLTAMTSPLSVAYGGGGGSSSSCSDPQFYEASPAKNDVVSELSQVYIVASDNADLSTLDFEIADRHIVPQVTTRPSGEFVLVAILPTPIKQPGKVRIAITAKSKDGCSGYYPYFVEVQP